MSIIPSRPQKQDKLRAIVQNKAVETVRTTMNIPANIHKKLKRRAVDENTTVTDITIKLYKDFLKE
jgi:hypothetical protein